MAPGVTVLPEGSAVPGPDSREGRVQVKFRRKSAEPESVADEAAADPAEQAPSGPYDADELPEHVAGQVAEQLAAAERVDLGSLVLAPFPGRELRLQVDESTGAVQAALLTAEDGALELRAFAAPRRGHQ